MLPLPRIGLGTWDLRGEDCVKAIQMALDLGYRHIDTAHLYQNHQEVARAIRGFDRKKLFITTKLDIGEQVDPKNPEISVQKACEKVLRELNTDYVDLYLIHYPDRNFPLDSIYRSMVKLIEQKKILRAGVSNYTIHHLQDLANAGYVPFVNQVEFHPYLNQQALLDYCRSHKIELMSYRSLGKGKLLSEDPIFVTIGTKYHKTGAQVLLRWLIEKGISVIPKASSAEHLRENIEIFDFSLASEDMATLDSLDKKKRYCDPDDTEFDY